MKINQIKEVLNSIFEEDESLKYALATGNWGVKANGKCNVKAGTAQVLNRLSYQSFI